MSLKDENEIFNSELIKIVKLNPWIFNRNIKNIKEADKEKMWTEIDEVLASNGIDVKSKCLYLLVQVIAYTNRIH